MSDAARAKPVLVADSVSRAIRAGLQTEDRRPLKVQPPTDWRPLAGWGTSDGVWRFTRDGAQWPSGCDVPFDFTAPWRVGDFLYLRETWTAFGSGQDRLVRYRSDMSPENAKRYVWRPNLHMKKADARTWLRVVDMEPVILQDITESQAREEGCPLNCHTPLAWFSGLWTGLYPQHPFNGPRVWVWRTCFGLSSLEEATSLRAA